MKLKGKRVLITAGAQGIGQAISQQFITAGAHVAIHYFSSSFVAQELAAKAQKEGLKAIAIQGDLCKIDDAQKVVDTAVNHLGGLDILINNAGSLIDRRTLESCDSNFWYKVIDTNISSAQFVTQAAAPVMKNNPNGSIVNLASLAGRKGGHPGSLVYSMAKGAILTWTRALANELGPHGIRVNAVAPGLILGTSFHNTHTTKDSAQATIASIPLQCAGTADDVARAVIFLASEYDGFINGATLDINGGVYCA
ncbi:SDR family NAD(P)-dependent oxidoreductase [Marinagarivorans cellulosilyticus]|uniref:3-oxoacyl-[acyl-carrier protein] reductase n=1 Tax=Marinagarivorans cellulosilyticus TaxID=2721545 RepID=A0AAN1WHV7_9GAMM|nr:SDR family oxidoreductase [Marinagarivorans cellulosilyticus]BCD97900.1 3-oxoacyl-[acyl-carrier protein] reductase [Marinagarivorans cellulosilyticus]